jgi:hypothetical protein
LFFWSSNFQRSNFLTKDAFYYCLN